MANLLVYNRAVQLLALHPDWVDGAPGLPGPVVGLLARAQGFLLRDIASQLKQSAPAEEVRQLGRSLVVKSATKGEKSLVVRTFDGETDPMNPNRWKELLERLFGGKIPVIPEREPGPYGFHFNLPEYLNTILLAEALQIIASVSTDKATTSAIQSLATQLGKYGLERGQFALGV